MKLMMISVKISGDKNKANHLLGNHQRGIIVKMPMILVNNYSYSIKRD
jgi:hypothetical protein